MQTPTATDTRARDTARTHLYRFLALLSSDPRSARWKKLFDPGAREPVLVAWAELAADPGSRPEELAPGELEPTGNELVPLFDFLEEPGRDHTAAHDRVFGLVVSKECPPYETQYCPQTFSVYRSERLADVAGFYRAFGVTPSRDQPERVDHIALELEFMAWLLTKEQHALARGGDQAEEHAEVCRDAQQKFFTEHLAWWVPAYAAALWRKAEAARPSPPAPAETLHGALASALAAFVPMERAWLSVPPPDELLAPRATEDGEASGCSSCSPDG